MKHFCNRDKKRKTAAQMGSGHCDGCTMKKTCAVNRTLNPAPRQPTMEEQFAQLGMNIVYQE